MLQQENSTLKGAIEDLKREAVRKENWESELKRYALHEAAQGLVVYGLKQSVSNGDPPHYLCANCFNDGKKTVLYYSTKTGSTRAETLNCKVCKTESPTGFSGGGRPIFVP